MRRAFVALCTVPFSAACSSSSGNSARRRVQRRAGRPRPITSPTTESSSATTAESATSGLAPTTAAPAAPSWTMFGGRPHRRRVTASGPSPAGLHKAWTSEELDGDIYGEPLVVAGRVLVVNEGDSVCAIDAASGKRAWRVNVGDPVPRSALECGNIDPTAQASSCHGVRPQVYLLLHRAQRAERTGDGVHGVLDRRLDGPAAEVDAQPQPEAGHVSRGGAGQAQRHRGREDVGVVGPLRGGEEQTGVVDDPSERPVGT
jgi:PQQ-like domain